MGQSLIGIIATIIIVVIFLIMKKKGFSSTANALAGNFSQKFCSLTGLTAGSDDFSGTYKDYVFNVKSEMGTDYAQAIQMKGMKVYPKLTVILRAAGSSFPYTVLREEHNVLVDTNQKLNSLITGGGGPLPAELSSLKGKLPRVNGVYSEEEAFAAKVVSDQELSALLSNWFYPNIILQGDRIVLRLDHENAQKKFGERMISPTYWVEAMDICVRLADVARG